MISVKPLFEEMGPMAAKLAALKKQETDKFINTDRFKPATVREVKPELSLRDKIGSRVGKFFRRSDRPEGLDSRKVGAIANATKPTEGGIGGALRNVMDRNKYLASAGE